MANSITMNDFCRDDVFRAISIATATGWPQDEEELIAVLDRLIEMLLNEVPSIH